MSGTATQATDRRPLMLGILAALVFLGVWVCLVLMTDIRFDIAMWAAGLAAGAATMFTADTADRRRGLVLGITVVFLGAGASLTIGWLKDPGRSERQELAQKLANDPIAAARHWMIHRFRQNDTDPELSELVDAFYIRFAHELAKDPDADHQLTGRQRDELDQIIADQIAQFDEERRQRMADELAEKQQPVLRRSERIASRFSIRNLVYLLLGFVTAFYFGAQGNRPSQPGEPPAERPPSE
ncbi:MAG: hypothetical protein JJU36_11215 [Phycisphaeraceae bacterium]|nr:hypothetical protein [Phycisphaeraceae bacterium]